MYKIVNLIITLAQIETTKEEIISQYFKVSKNQNTYQ